MNSQNTQRALSFCSASSTRRPQVSVICDACGKNFLRFRYLHERSIRKSIKEFCCRRCFHAKRLRVCPKCGSMRTDTVFSKKQFGLRRRRHNCLNCGAKFLSFEGKNEKLCKCGCGLTVETNKKFIDGHDFLRHAHWAAKLYGYRPPNTISFTDAQKLWESQGGMCIACLEYLDKANAVLDHCHETGAIRGYTCNRCNFLEGALRQLNHEQLNRWILFYRSNRLIQPIVDLPGIISPDGRLQMRAIRKVVIKINTTDFHQSCFMTTNLRIASLKLFYCYQSPGLKNRLKQIIFNAKSKSKICETAPLRASIYVLLVLWSRQDESCAACGGKFEQSKKQMIHLDHDHNTGYPRGFVHRNCNRAEGLSRNMGLQSFLNWLNFYRSDMFTT